MQEIFNGIFREGDRLYTINLINRKRVYGERLIRKGGIEYREWDPFRSKLAGAIMKGLKKVPINEESKVLYLGAATGTTASHISDIAYDGEVFAVEISPIAIKKLIANCEERDNLYPIMADASKPEEYKEVGEVDILYEDVAQRNQTEILIKNAKKFLKDGGYAMYAIKSRSISMEKDPKEIFDEQIEQLKEYFSIEQKLLLEPYDKDHMFVLLRK